MIFWRRIALWSFSVGWLVPMGLGLLLADQWFAGRVYDAVQGRAGKPILNSFEPYFAARPCILVAFLWLSLAVMYWAWKLVYPGAKS